MGIRPQGAAFLTLRLRHFFSWAKHEDGQAKLKTIQMPVQGMDGVISLHSNLSD